MKAVFGTKKGADALRVLLAAVLVVLLLASLCALAACNKNEPDPAKERADAVTRLETNTLAALGEDWTPDVPRETLIRMPDCASYLEARRWVSLVAGVLSRSGLQTAKISLIADFAASEDGKRLLSDAANNADAVLGFVSAVGFTSEDVSEVGFELLRAVVTDVRELYVGLAEELEALKGSVVGDGQADIAAATERAERVVASFGDEDKAEESIADTVAALDEAKEGIGTLFAFAYDAERIFGTGESGEGLSSVLGSAAGGSGALAGVSDGEMLTWLDGMVSGLREFGASMTEEKTASVKAALKSVRECFQGFAQPVAAVGDVMEWLRVAESFADEIPTIVSYALSACNVIYERNAEDTYTYDFVRKLRLLAEEEDEELRTVNTYALGAELFLSFAESHNAAELKGWIRDMAKEGTGLKSALIYAFALMAAQAESDGDVEVTPDLVSMISVLLTEVFGSLMDETWRKYVLFPEKYENRLRIVSGLVISFAESVNELNAGGAQVDINVSSSGPYDSEWYAEVMRIREETTRNAGGTDGDALADKATAVIGEYIDASYARLDELRAAASVGYITDADSAEATKLTEEVQSNPIFMVFAFFFMQK